MTNEKYRIREICGDWALDIPFPGSVVTIFFNSRTNAELVKKILIHEDAHPGEAVPFMQDYFPDTTKTVSLTLEQLREMDGKPVWVETGNKFSDWGKVDFKRGRIWTFGTEDEWWDFRYYGDWLPYAYQPAHIDLETQEIKKSMIDINNLAVSYIENGPYENDMPGMELAVKIDAISKKFCETAYYPAHIDRESWMAEWTVDEFGHKCSKCGEYLPDGEDVRKPQFCPECGRATTPEAWAMLEKRLRG